MTKQEFESRLEDGKAVSVEQYRVIEYVYMYHPAIDAVRGKDQIAILYNMFGMTVINDMYPRAARAEKVEKVEKDLAAARSKVVELTRLLDHLKAGEWPDVPDVTDVN